MADDALAQLIAAARTAADAEPRALPPVHLWNPPSCGRIDIRIRRDGLWFHEGSPIGRPALVRLFSTVLRKDDDVFYLVTPVEKLQITVDDAPFTAVRVDREGPDLVFQTNVGDRVTAGPDHAIRVQQDAPGGEPRPYLHVRSGLDALIVRAVFYELVSLGEARDGRLVVASGGATFDLGPLEVAA